MSEPTFEHLLAGLEEHTRRLEEGGLPLAEALDLYEQGVGMAKALTEMLQQAELRVERLSAALEVQEEPDEWYDESYDEDEDAPWTNRSRSSG